MGGTIYAVTHQSTQCAVKQIDRSDRWMSKNVAAEVRVLSQLRHQGIIGFEGLFVDKKFYYVAMERADYDLKHLMTTSGSLDESRTKSITYALLQSLAYLHSENTVHRDLKPENIVFCGENPKIIDFGDAKRVTDDTSYTDFVGSPPYMAPERLREHKGWQLKRSDVWAIGVIAFEMLTGRRCFPGTSQQEVFEKITGNQWSWPQRNTDDMPSEEMQSFVAECLCMDPVARPSAEKALSHPWFSEFTLKEG